MLLAYYKLDDASSQDRRDVSGNGRTLTRDGTVTEATGKLGSGAQFVSTDGARLRSSDTAFNFGDEDFTLDFWIYIPDFDNDYPSPIGKWGTGAGSYSLTLGRNENEWWWSVSSDGSTSTSMSLGVGVPMDTWTHVMLAHDSVNNLLIARINHGTPITQSYSGGVYSSPTVPFAIGKGNQDYSGSFASCTVDELGVWGRLLSSAEQDIRWNGGAGSTIDAPITFDSSGTPTLEDHFEGDTLNTSLWNNVSPFFDPYRGGNGNNGAGGPNLSDNVAFVAEAVTVAGGYAVLTSNDVSGAPVLGQDSTAGIITSLGKFSQLYGRFQARMKILTGTGFHCTFWMKPVVNEWPPEIDVAEFGGLNTRICYQSLHWQNGENFIDAHDTREVDWNIDFSGDFHTYEIDWSPGLIIWYIDGVETNRQADNVPDAAMFLIFTVEMGNLFSGPADPDLMPASMLIDYVKVWLIAGAEELPYQGDTTIYVATDATGSVVGGTILSGPIQDSPIGSVIGGTILLPEAIY